LGWQDQDCTVAQGEKMKQTGCKKTETHHFQAHQDARAGPTNEIVSWAFWEKVLLEVHKVTDVAAHKRQQRSHRHVALEGYSERNYRSQLQVRVAIHFLCV
jgi:hypothetical protein